MHCPTLKSKSGDRRSVRCADWQGQHILDCVCCGQVCALVWVLSFAPVCFLLYSYVCSLIHTCAVVFVLQSVCPQSVCSQSVVCALRCVLSWCALISMLSHARFHICSDSCLCVLSCQVAEDWSFSLILHPRCTDHFAPLCRQRLEPLITTCALRCGVPLASKRFGVSPAGTIFSEEPSRNHWGVEVLAFRPELRLVCRNGFFSKTGMEYRSTRLTSTLGSPIRPQDAEPLELRKGQREGHHC